MAVARSRCRAATASTRPIGRSPRQTRRLPSSSPSTRSRRRNGRHARLLELAAELVNRVLGIHLQARVRIVVADAEHATAHAIARLLERRNRFRIAELYE